MTPTTRGCGRSSTRTTANRYESYQKRTTRPIPVVVLTPACDAHGAIFGALTGTRL